MWVEYGSTMTARMRLRAKNAHVFGADTPLGVVDEALVEQVKAVCASRCEELTQRRLGELPDWHVVVQLRVTLVVVAVAAVSASKGRMGEL